MTYFKDVNTSEELRKQYRDLLKKYHPDNPQGSTEATQAINAEYDKLFKILKNKHESMASDNKESKGKSDYNNMKYDFSEDRALREMLNKIISFSGITIEICGCWIWAFNSYAYRKELKETGFKYAPKKQAWYWHSEAFRKKSHKALSMDDIRNYYGSTEIKTEEKKPLKQALKIRSPAPEATRAERIKVMTNLFGKLSIADEQYQIKRLAREFLKDIIRTGKDGNFAAQEYYDGGMWGMLYYAYMRGI